jgi:CBS domain-containing protein
MNIREFCIHEVACVARTATVAEAAALMREFHVGDLVVIVVDTAGRRKPIGIVTDRDIVVEVVAAGVAPASIGVADLLQRPLITVRDDKSFADVARLMSAHGVRRIPVVDAHGDLVGIVSHDDVLRQLASPLAALAELPRRGHQQEMRARP